MDWRLGRGSDGDPGASPVRQGLDAWVHDSSSTGDEPRTLPVSHLVGLLQVTRPTCTGRASGAHDQLPMVNSWRDGRRVQSLTRTVAPSYGLDGNATPGYSSVEPASPKIPRPGDRSRISTTWAKGPGSKGGPGLWVFRSLTTRSRAAANSSLVIPVAIISAIMTSLNRPRTPTTSSRDNSAICTSRKRFFVQI